jgi:hypothetical protein
MAREELNSALTACQLHASCLPRLCFPSRVLLWHALGCQSDVRCTQAHRFCAMLRWPRVEESHWNSCMRSTASSAANCRTRVNGLPLLQFLLPSLPEARLSLSAAGFMKAEPATCRHWQHKRI